MFKLFKNLRSFFAALRSFGNPPVMTDTVFCTYEPAKKGPSTVWLHYQDKPSEPLEVKAPIPDFGAYIAACIRNGEGYAPETEKDYVHHIGDGRGTRRVFVDGVYVPHCLFADTKRGYVECRVPGGHTAVHNGVVTVEFDKPKIAS